MNILGRGFSIFLFAVAALVGCGGGDGPDGDSPPPVNSPPVAAFTANPSSGAAPLFVQVDASASSDPGGSVASYSWNFGDGSEPGSGVTAGHTYVVAGTFQITLTVTDNQGASATTTRQISVSRTLVPNVLGFSEADARAAITSAALAVGSVATSSSSSVTVGNVIVQYPAGGVAVSTGTAVSLIISSGPGGSGSLLQISLVEPKPGGLVADQAVVTVMVASSYEIGSATASMAGRETPLVADPGTCAGGASCLFVGTLSLTGLPTGPYPLTIRATDTRGNMEQIAVFVVHDNPPQLVITAPLDDSVALPTLPVDVRCSDDLPGCIVELSVSLYDDPGDIFASSPAEFRAPVDLSRWMNSGVSLWLSARDSSNQVRDEVRRVFVGDPARLRVLAEMPSGIVAADSTRLMYLEAAAAGDSIAIHNRTTGLTERVAFDDGWVRSAWLTPTGAIFEALPRESAALESRLYLWRGGALEDLGQSTMYSLAVSGSYAIWNVDSSLYLLNTDGGAARLISSEASNLGNAVAADGTVAFANSSSQIVRDRDGQQTTLTSDPNFSHTNPVTDGDNVVYRQSTTVLPWQSAIQLIEGTAPVLLAAMRDPWVEPGKDYQIAAGWAAYTDLGTQGQLHVFTRSPSGVITRHTDLSTSSYLDRIGVNGEVMVINGKQRFFSRGDGMIVVSSAAGRSYQFNGVWHVAIGRAYLEVDTLDQ